jgi:hypothetical protein
MERYFVVLNDAAREAVAVRLVGLAFKETGVTVSKAAPAADSPSDKKGGMFSRLFGKKS